MNNEKEIDIDLGRIFGKLRNKIVYILLATLIAAAISGCISEFFITPKYSATCKLYVYSNTDRSNSSTVSEGELKASQRLVNTYIEALESNTILQKVIDNLSLKMSVKQLRGMITAAQVADTEFFSITVTTTSPTASADICNSVAEVAPNEMIRVLKVGGVEVLDYATVPTSPSSPKIKKNILIGAIVGFAVSFVGFFLQALFDTTVQSERDLEREFDIPVIGMIPRLVPAQEPPKNGENINNTEAAENAD